jgi:hypothetical protein
MPRAASNYDLGVIVTTGVAAGMIFALFEMLAAALAMGADAALMPLRMIGAIVLGAAALDPSYSLAMAAVTGLVVHLILSIIFTAIFAATLGRVAIAAPQSVPARLALAGILFGFGLWVVNFYVIAPVASWTWFPDRTNPIVQFVAHTFFFGCPVGWMLGRARAVITV